MKKMERWWLWREASPRGPLGHLLALWLNREDTVGGLQMYLQPPLPPSWLEIRLKVNDTWRTTCSNQC